MVKLASLGRGTGYSPLRGVMESVLGLAYAGDWPARLYGRFAKSRRVRASRHALALLPPGAPLLRIAFVSDVHLGPTTADVTVEQAFALLRDAAPESVLPRELSSAVPVTASRPAPGKDLPRPAPPAPPAP